MLWKWVDIKFAQTNCGHDTGNPQLATLHLVTIQNYNSLEKSDLQSALSLMTIAAPP